MTIPFLYGISLGFLIGMATFTEWAIYQHRKMNKENNCNESMLWMLYIAGKEKRTKENVCEE